MLSQRNVGLMYALLATGIWGGAYVVARLAVGQISPLTLGACRWTVALIILCTFALPRVKAEMHLVKKFMPQLIIAAITGITLYSPLSYFAAQTSPAVNMGLISVTSPIFVMLILLTKGQKPSMNSLIGCTIALLGSVYLVANGSLKALMDFNFVVGDIYMLAGTIGFAFYSIALSKLPEGLSQLTVLTVINFLGLIFMIPLLIWEYSTPEFVFNLNGTVIFSIAFTGLCASLVAWGSWNIALEKIGPVLANIIYYSMPIFSAIIGFIAIGEGVNSVQIVSFLLIVGGILWSSRGSAKS